MNYNAYFDELNNLSVEATKSYNEKKKKKKDEVVIDDLLDFIEDLLIDAIAVGVVDANEDLGTNYSFLDIYSTKEANELIYRDVAGANWVKRIFDKVSADTTETLSEKDITRLVETEAHRVVNDAKFTVAQTVKSKTGKSINKKWVTVKDDRVRDTHKGIDDKVVGLMEKFVTSDGDSAYYPGGFTNANNNINCRCIVKFI